jgi:hypothetical protein
MPCGSLRSFSDPSNGHARGKDASALIGCAKGILALDARGIADEAVIEGAVRSTIGVPAGGFLAAFGGWCLTFWLIGTAIATTLLKEYQ